MRKQFYSNSGLILLAVLAAGIWTSNALSFLADKNAPKYADAASPPPTPSFEELLKKGVSGHNNQALPCSINAELMRRRASTSPDVEQFKQFVAICRASGQTIQFPQFVAHKPSVLKRGHSGDCRTPPVPFREQVAVLNNHPPKLAGLVFAAFRRWAELNCSTLKLIGYAPLPNLGRTVRCRRPVSTPQKYSRLSSSGRVWHASRTGETADNEIY
jgi:hypothetical protein